MALSCARAVLRFAAIVCVLLLLPAVGHAEPSRAVPLPEIAAALFETVSTPDDAQTSALPGAATASGEEWLDADLPPLGAALASLATASRAQAIVDDRPGLSLLVAPEVPPSRPFRTLRKGAGAVV